jgi:DNA-binding PadR family transcriptional regulator
MDMSKVQKILKVCNLVSQMPSGGGWVRPSEIVTWSSVPHATTYRYLAKLQKLGYVRAKAEGYRNGIIKHYTITDAGMGYLDTFGKEML